MANNEIRLDGIELVTRPGTEQMRILGARKWYAPWSRYPDVVITDCNFSCLPEGLQVGATIRVD